MKTLKTLIAIILLSTFQVKAQKVSDSTEQLINTYYQIKNALIRSDNNLAGEKALILTKFAGQLGLSGISAEKAPIAKSIQIKIISNAHAIAVTSDLEKQRVSFASLSADIYDLAKLQPLSDRPIYQAFCPMKKSYWLSAEPLIKNPYYGAAMLTCGKITDTIIP